LFYCSVINVRLSIPAYKPLLICFILLPLWAVFVALARGDLIIISPMGQVVNIIFQVFWFFFESFCIAIKNPSVYAGLQHFIFTIKYHILQNFIVFSAFSLCFYQHFSDAYCIYGSIFFITVLPAKHYLLPRDIFCFYKKQKTAGAAPAVFSFILFIYYL
jgi:hypothetical protein